MLAYATTGELTAGASRATPASLSVPILLPLDDYIKLAEVYPRGTIFPNHVPDSNRFAEFHPVQDEDLAFQVVRRWPAKPCKMSVILKDVSPASLRNDPFEERFLHIRIEGK